MDRTLTVAERRAAEEAFQPPLKGFVSIDRDGHASFSYAAQCGEHRAILDHIAAMLADPKRRRQNAAYIAENLERISARDALWKDYVEQRYPTQAAAE